jgi:hypothetical protein
MNEISRSKARRSDVPRLTLVRDRSSLGHARQGPRAPLGDIFAYNIDEQSSLEWLEAENLELRDRAIALALQIQALRDALRS